MTDIYTLLCVGVVVLGTVGGVAPMKGINGKLFTTVVGAITLIVGYGIPR